MHFPTAALNFVNTVACNCNKFIKFHVTFTVICEYDVSLRVIHVLNVVTIKGDVKFIIFRVFKQRNFV